MTISTLRLFNAIQVESRNGVNYSPELLSRTIKNGYVLDPSIEASEALLNIIEDVIGISGEKANASFHKSWEIVRNSSIEQLVIQQIMHYVTTYGFERFGIVERDCTNNPFVYIPKEELDLPEITNDIPLVYIRAMTGEELLEEIINLGSGIALAKETLADIMDIIQTNRFETFFVEKIGNRELKAMLYDYYNIVPSEPVEFLRHVVSKLTDESLIIKNKQLIEKIEKSNGKFLDTLMEDAPDDLATIFLRYKPLFLAMKKISRNKTFYNQLRKKAKLMHSPLSEDYLNSVTKQIKTGKLNLDILQGKLKDATVFRKIRLAYALKHRMDSGDSIVYRVRNGRGWATEFIWSAKYDDITQNALDIVCSSIAENVRKNVEGKVIYIPERVHYTLPATEKQFTGHLPTGSYVTVPEDLIVGIHWFNSEHNRIDIDLSLLRISGKIGWDAGYRTADRDVMFSGDVTDAPRPRGATELFYMRAAQTESNLLMANYYNFWEGNECECKILVAKEKPRNFRKNYMIDVNNIIASAIVNLDKKQNVLGLITSVDGENRVYFANVAIGKSITSGNSLQMERTREFFVKSMTNSLELIDILKMAGATVVHRKPEEVEYIDLSAETLNKSTIINLIK